MTVGLTDYPGSGGWRASTYRDRTRISEDIPFLASQRYTVKRSGATFKKSAGTGTGTAEVQTLAASGATAGTFTLTFNGQTTSALAFSATAAQVQTALQALTTVGNGGITATGGPAQTTNIVLTFAGTLLGTGNQPLIVLDKSGLTGGGAAAVSETTRGQLPYTSEIKKGTFVLPDTANLGYYKVWVTGDAIVLDGSSGPPGYLMESINVADGDVTEGILIMGSVLTGRLQPNPHPAAITTAMGSRIVYQ
jgi:hypothetical protein